MRKNKSIIIAASVVLCIIIALIITQKQTKEEPAPVLPTPVINNPVATPMLPINTEDVEPSTEPSESDDEEPIEDIDEDNDNTEQDEIDEAYQAIIAIKNQQTDLPLNPLRFLSTDEFNELKEEMENEGYTIETYDDGSVVIASPDGTVYEQNRYGKWTINGINNNGVEYTTIVGDDTMPRQGISDNIPFYFDGTVDSYTLTDKQNDIYISNCGEGAIDNYINQLETYSQYHNVPDSCYTTDTGETVYYAESGAHQNSVTIIYNQNDNTVHMVVKEMTMYAGYTD